MSSSKPTSTASRTACYQATKNESSLSIHELDIQKLNIEKLSQEMNQRAKDATPFSKDEIDEIVKSFENVMPANSGISLDALKELVEAVAHLSHKDWSKTEQSATTLNDILLKGDLSGELSPEFKQIFKRVIEEGNWNGASDFAETRSSKPWAILVTGVNGIRKTTSVYQPWFQQLLSEALVHPTKQDVDTVDIPLDTLPTGENSFFRQLDHMIITLINHNFQKLYAMTDLSHDFDSGEPPSSIIQQYSNYKAAIFSRYRTLSEILGVLLVKQARASSLNIMVETSGRDVAMFHYVDSFFPSEEYNKLALHFTINDLSHAETSVDKRMVREMKVGIEALQSGNVDQVIKANAGGPYGSEVLKGIQRDSDAVWDTIISEGDSDVGKDWYKASFNINASADEDWTAFATKPDGTDGTVFTFEAPRKV